jgi:protein-disulfide isomerase
MAELAIEVFTSPTCPHCPGAVIATEELLKNNPELAEKIKWAELSTASVEGSRKAREYGIRSVPTIILTNKKGEKGGYVGAPTQKTYLKIVEEMLK